MQAITSTATPPRASCRDIIKVTAEGHEHHGKRAIVISAVAGIGGRYIHACLEDRHDVRLGLKHEDVEVVGQLRHLERLPH